MEKMLNEIKRSINPSDKIIVGVSGGADSMVLLDLLVKANQNIPFTLQVVHIEHGIRGAESKADAMFVNSFCKQHDVACDIFSADIPALAKKTKQTIEQCARNFRYQQFEKYTNKGYKLFLAHNKNDQAETVLMHIFRGSGLDGAKGITSRDNIYRPLLMFTKQQILEYAKINNVKFVEDSTNNNSDYTRNFLRNIILPQIEQKYPSVIENIARFAEICEQSQNIIDEQINPEWIKNINNVIYVNREVFSKHQLIVAKVVKTAYNYCGRWADLESRHITLLCDFVASCKNGSMFNLPHEVVAELRQDCVLFYINQQKNNNNCIFCVGETQLPNSRTICVSKVSDDIVFGNGCLYADYYKIPQNAVWRTRQQGDVFQKLGSRGKKSLNDYFTDKKLSKVERENTLLLASGNNILLVLGYDISENVKIDSDTMQIVKIESCK